VRDYEPHLAVVGGVDGLLLLRPLLERSGEFLVPGGLLAVEVMVGQAEVVQALAARIGGWGEAEVVCDLAGIPRVVLWRREMEAP
jgi:release factor glutamine methyltransferase